MPNHLALCIGRRACVPKVTYVLIITARIRNDRDRLHAGTKRFSALSASSYLLDVLLRLPNDGNGRRNPFRGAVTGNLRSESNAEIRMHTAASLSSHAYIEYLFQHMVGNHRSSEETETELPRDDFEAGARAKCPCLGRGAAFSINSASGRISNFLKHCFH